MTGNQRVAHQPIVVQIGKYYHPYPGGIENNTRQVATAIADCCRSYVVCMRPTAGSASVRRVDGLPVLELASLGVIWRQQLVVPLTNILKRIQPTAVHFHSPNPLLAFHLLNFLKRHPHVKLIITHHADLERPEWVRRLANWAYYRLLARADWIITYTEQAFAASRELAPYHHKKVIIPHGVSIPESNQARTADRSDGQLVAGFLGRLEGWKGVQHLLQATQSLVNYRLNIAGQGSYRRTLESLSQRLGMDLRVEFLGNVTGQQKRAFLDNLDVLVLPSLNNGETFGQCLVEAQLAGVPVIASDLPTGIQAIVRHGQTGLLIPPGDTAALHAALEQLSDPAERRRIGRAGRFHAERNFSQPVAVQQLQCFYRDTVFSIK